MMILICFYVSYGDAKTLIANANSVLYLCTYYIGPLPIIIRHVSVLKEPKEKIYTYCLGL